MPATRDSLWDDLARETWLSRQYARECAYVLVYGGKIDPWLDSIVTAALEKVIEKRKAA